MEQTNDDYCWYHEIQFESVKNYTEHCEKECKEMLKNSNVCTFVKENGSCCRKKYNHISTLILHYKSEHKKYACAKCYKIFERKDDLEQHEHPQDANYRESK